MIIEKHFIKGKIAKGMTESFHPALGRQALRG
jgi:hypothetical protein